MKSILALFLLHIAFISYSGQTPEYVPQVMLKSSIKNSKLQTNEAVYIFVFNVYDEKTSERIIMYSIDDLNGTQKLDDQNQISLKSSPGSHIFQFYYNDQYEEVYTDSLIIKSQFVNTYEVRLESSEFPVIVDKPVIYLYPEKETHFSVSIQPKGKMAFTYPTYNDSWEGNAQPNGDITIGNETFNYLFWEAEQKITTEILDQNKGSIIEGSNAVEFLTKQLNSFGLNSKEKADFITYWGPKIVKNEFNYVYFVLNNEADYFAELAITPSPDNIYRLYILTCPVVNPSDFHYLEPQLIESINRKGFTVIEWGGSVIDIKFAKKRRQIL